MTSWELLDRIKEAAINNDVIGALLLCQELGDDADSAELRDWAKHELEGHPQEVMPPEYRRVRGQLFGRGAAPGQRIPAVPIPMDLLPEAERREFAKGIPIWDSLSEIVANSKKERVGWMPSNPSRLLRRVNAANAAPVVFDEIYFGISGAAFTGVVTAVRSRIVSLVSQLRGSLPADQQPDSTAGKPAASEVATRSVVHITGDHAQVAVGAGGDIQQDAATEGRSKDGLRHRIWRWLKRILEAVTVIGAVVAFLGGGSINPF